MPACPDILRDDAETSERLKAIALEVHELGSGLEDESERIHAAGVNLVKRGVDIGDLLNEAFDLLPKDWERWCEANLSFSVVTAYKYRTLAAANAKDPTMLTGVDSLRQAYLLCGVIKPTAQALDGEEAAKSRKARGEAPYDEKLRRAVEKLELLLGDRESAAANPDAVLRTVSALTQLVAKYAPAKTETKPRLTMVNPSGPSWQDTDSLLVPRRPRLSKPLPPTQPKLKTFDWAPPNMRKQLLAEQDERMARQGVATK